MPDGIIAVITPPPLRGRNEGSFAVTDEKDEHNRPATTRTRATRSARGTVTGVRGATGVDSLAAGRAARAATGSGTPGRDAAESGVVPVLFSASAEAHDTAVAAPDHGTDWRSPFGEPLRPASGE
ncbi:hypothetical protein [Amycolatopsis ultiminotia]|uniref:hypothetical protein n=1 Tax=Amycolatopsis ultiminotia TaxID=543629 RepID=UPI0031F12518